MEKIWIIAIVLFLLTCFLFWYFTKGYFKKEYGEKMWKNWGSRLFYWQGVIYTSTGITIVIMFILKWTKVLTF